MISIIIPTYNEAEIIRNALKNLPPEDENNLEVIIADGGSNDATVEIARGFSVKVIYADKGRARQMNQAAEKAKGEILLFLHADCRVDSSVIGKIENCINQGYAGGGLTQKILAEPLIYRFIETTGNYRAKLLKIFYGDQAIFVRRDMFFKLGGFDKVDLFEDVIFTKKMRKAGKVCLLEKKVYASARRWQKQGVVKTTVLNWLISLGFMFGISPNFLKKVYLNVR